MKQRFIISRTDAIGDVVLTLPVAALLKQHYRECEVIFLARHYVKDIVTACLDVDQFLNWDELSKMSEEEAAQTLQNLHAEVILHVKPNPRIARLAKLAKIKIRIGTSRRWYHFLTCNRLVRFSRAKSTLHEAQLNLKLLPPLNIGDTFSLKQLVSLTHLQPNQPLTDKVKNYLDPQRFNLIIHPLSNGHSREWPLSYYCQLIHALPQDKINIIITGSPAELERLQEPLINQCPEARNAVGALSLADLMALIQHSDGILVGSTGPLHIAAAIGIHTLGLFPPKKVMSAHRWGPIGKQAHYLMLDKDCNACNKMPADQCACMREISVSRVKQTILGWIPL